MDHINAPFEERDEEPVGVLQEYIKNLRPWTEFFNPKSFSTTQNSTDAATGTWHKSALKRIQTNFSYYLSNYSILPLILCSLTLIFNHWFILICLILIGLGYYYIFFVMQIALIDQDSDRFQKIVVSWTAISGMLLLFSGALSVLFWSIGFSVLLITSHALLHTNILVYKILNKRQNVTTMMVLFLCMALKNFIHFLKDSFSSSFKRFDIKRPIDECYLDMNCLWHQAGRLQPMPLDPKLLKKVLEEFPLGKSHSKVEKSHPNSKSPTLSSNSAVRSPFSYGQIQALDKIPIFTTMSRLMQSIFLKSYFSSSSIWYLAMDGVAPVAKIKHQLVRRDDQDMLVSKGLVHQNPRKGILLQDTRNGFIAVESLQGSPQMESESEFLFSTRIISPGNTFMSLLDRQCLRIITDTLITQKSNARNTSTKSTSSIFVFDPSTIPGEGDQKIFKAISASRKSNGCSKKNRLIISVDSDILLTVIAQGIDGAQCADPLKFLNSSDSLIFQYDLLISDLKAIFRTEDPNELAKIRTDLVFLVQCGGTDYFPSLSNHQLSFIWKCYLILKTASLKSSVKRDFDCLINRESKSINLREFSLLLKAVLSQSSSTLTEFPSCDDKLCNEVSTYFQCILSHMHLIITNEPFDFYDHYRRQVGPGGCSIQRSFSYLDLISVFGRWMAQGKWTLNLQADIKVDFTEEQIPIISSMFLLGPLRETVLPSFALQIIEEAGLKVPQLFHPDYYHLLWQYYADAMKNHISQMSLQEKEIYLQSSTRFICTVLEPGTTDNPEKNFKIAILPVKERNYLNSSHCSLDDSLQYGLTWIPFTSAEQFISQISMVAIESSQGKEPAAWTSNGCTSGPA